MEIRDKVAVVTGASSGFGEEMALRLAARGAKVVIVARRADRLEALARRIEASGGAAVAVVCDVADPEQVQGLPAKTEEAFGPCDILVNNAGIAGRGAFTKMDDADIESVIRVNVLGVMWGTRAFLPRMLERRRGHIVNVASLAGRFATPGAEVYGASKHAVVAFSEALASTVRDRGVLVTSLNPGFVQTEGFPQAGDRPKMLTLTVDQVADALIHIIEDDVSPEYSLPRWAAGGQIFRLIVPGLYRRVMRKAARSVPSKP